MSTTPNIIQGLLPALLLDSTLGNWFHGGKMVVATG